MSCEKCGSLGRTIPKGDYCSCPSGQMLKEIEARKALERPDLIKRFGDFDLKK